MAGLIGHAPIYFNGIMALLFVFVFPGLVFVRALAISNFPQRWFVVFLSSLVANHLLVTLIAALHLDPLQTYRAATVVLIVVQILLVMKGRARSDSLACRGAATILLSDLCWLVFSLIFLGFTYINVWKHGVPNIFEGGDVSVTWNTWALIWSQGHFPTSSLGYPQFVPTIWAVTYIFTGSTQQYFAFYVYIFWIVVPIVLNAMSLGRLNWWQPLAPGLAFIWLIVEIRDPWLKSALPQGYPDWVATIFTFCGVVLFVASTPKDRFGSERITAALISLCLVSIAAAIKPQYGLFTAVVFIAMCTDAAKYLQPRERTRLTIVAVGLVSVFAAAYAANYLHLTITRIPDHSLPIADRLSRALMLFNTNFSLPFRVLVLAGVALSPFVARVRWLALPLVVGVSSWALMLSYDLRNLLGFLLISTFIPLFALVRSLAQATNLSSERRWSVPDGAVACGLAVLVFGLTSSLAQGDKALEQRFATEQLTKGAGLEINQKIDELVRAGCTIFNADSYLPTISAFERFQDKIIFFFSTLPLNDGLINEVNQTSGCTGFFYPPDHTHPSILDFISATAKARSYTRLIEGHGMELLVSDAIPHGPR